MKGTRTENRKLLPGQLQKGAVRVHDDRNSIPAFDKIDRLPLGPATAWEVARLVTLKYVAHKTSTARTLEQPFPPVSPTEIRTYLADRLGWAPGPGSLYTGILTPLRTEKALTLNTHADRPGASEVHLLSTYTPGPKMEEILRIRTPRVVERLQVSLRMLAAVLPKLQAAGGPPPAQTIATNAGTLTRWLCLYAIDEASGLPAATLHSRVCALTTTSSWPSPSMTYRALKELTYADAVTYPGGQAALTPTGRRILRNLAAALVQPVKRALRFAEGALDILNA